MTPCAKPGALVNCGYPIAHERSTDEAVTGDGISRGLHDTSKPGSGRTKGVRNLFRSPDAAEGGSILPESDPSTPDPIPVASVEPQAAAPLPPAPTPEAAAVVVRGGKVEADAARDLEEKKLQSRIAQLEDEKRRLLEAQAVPSVNPTAKAQKKSFLEGGSFFD